MKIILFPVWRRTEGGRIVDPNRLTRWPFRKREMTMRNKSWQQLTKWNQSEDFKYIQGLATSMCWWTGFVELVRHWKMLVQLFKRCRRQGEGELVPGLAVLPLLGCQGSFAVFHVDIRVPTPGNGLRAHLLFHTHILVISGCLGRKSYI